MGIILNLVVPWVRIMQAHKTIETSRSFPASVEKTPRGFCYSSSSQKAEGSMSMIGPSAILVALISASTDFDHGISESSATTPNLMQRALPRRFRSLFAITLRLSSWNARA